MRAISGTRGSSGLGSQSREQTDSRTWLTLFVICHVIKHTPCWISINNWPCWWWELATTGILECRGRLTRWSWCWGGRCGWWRRPWAAWRGSRWGSGWWGRRPRPGRDCPEVPWWWPAWPIVVSAVWRIVDYNRHWRTCQWNRSSPTGPAEHWAGGSRPRSCSSLFILFRAIFGQKSLV